MCIGLFVNSLYLEKTTYYQMPGLILFSIASQFPTKRSEIVTYFWYVKHFIPINLHLTAIIANQNVENKMIPPN